MFYIYCAPEGKNYASDLPQPTFMVREGQNEIAEPVCEDMTFLYEASSDNTYQILTRLDDKFGAQFGFYPRTRLNPFLDLSELAAMRADAGGTSINSFHIKMPAPVKDYRIIHFNTIVSPKVEAGKKYEGNENTSPLYWVGVNLMNLSDTPEKIAEKFTAELNAKQREPNARIGIIFYYSAPQDGALSDKVAAMKKVIVANLKGSITLQTYNTFNVKNESMAHDIKAGGVLDALPETITCPGNEKFKGETFTLSPKEFKPLERNFSSYSVDEKCMQNAWLDIKKRVTIFGHDAIRKQIKADGGLIYPFYIVDAGFGRFGLSLPSEWNKNIEGLRCLNQKDEECMQMIDGYNILMKIF